MKLRGCACRAVLPLSRNSGRTAPTWERLPAVLSADPSDLRTWVLGNRDDTGSLLAEASTAWLSHARAHLASIFQVSDADAPKHLRSASLTPSHHDDSKLVFPAWGKAKPYPRACAEAAAWRQVANRLRCLLHAAPAQRLGLLALLRGWRPPSAITARHLNLDVRGSAEPVASTGSTGSVANVTAPLHPHVYSDGLGQDRVGEVLSASCVPLCASTGQADVPSLSPGGGLLPLGRRVRPGYPTSALL